MMKIVFFLTIVMVGLVSCGSGPVPVEFQTDILGINIAPRPGVVGEDITFTCIIEDSLDSRFQFFWIFSPFDSTRITEENFITVKFDDPGDFGGRVRANNGEEGKEPISASFSFSVVNPMEN